MEFSLFLMLAALSLGLLGAIKSANSLRNKLSQKVPVKQLHTTVTVLIVTAQISELVKMIEHISIVNISAALFLLVIVLAAKSGTEGELH